MTTASEECLRFAYRLLFCGEVADYPLPHERVTLLPLSFTDER
jgi:hypothetical protein